LEFGISSFNGGEVAVKSGASVNFVNTAGNGSSGIVTIEGGAFCIFNNGCLNDGTLQINSSASAEFYDSASRGNLTIQSNASVLFSGGYCNGAATIAAGGLISFKNETYNKAEIYGNGSITYDKRSLLKTLNGGARAGSTSNTQYPTNFGAGTL